MSKIPIHGRTAIRRSLKQVHDETENYKETARRTGLSDGTVWRLLNQKGFWPKSPKVKNQIKEYGKSKGIIVGRRPLPKE